MLGTEHPNVDCSMSDCYHNEDGNCFADFVLINDCGEIECYVDEEDN